jgi:ribonuclease HI
MKRQIQVVTDGSAIGNPGLGGWAAVFRCDKRRWTISGSVLGATASEMELTAAIEALRSVEHGSIVVLQSDSEYLIHGMRYLAVRWRKQGWRNARGSPLKHWELWQDLLRLNAMHTVRWQWVRGHNGHPMQTQADSLAYAQARQLLVESRRAA